MAKKHRSKLEMDGIADVIGGVLLASVGLLFVFGTWEFGILRDGGRLDAGAMPVFTGSLLALCGVMIALVGLKGIVGARSAASRVAITSATSAASAAAPSGIDDQADTTDAAAGGDADDDDFNGTGTTAKAMVVLAMSVGAVWLAPRIGFLLAFAILLFVLWVWLEGVKPLKALMLTAAVILFTHILFVQFLRIPLPRTPFL
jgi:hypothetical protein